ncbi:MAG: serine/threonine protein phosphatase [Ruminococcaceae bacterium]|nr:serine/threonine protein phosphatase [Oscillospiraceae bacterium]
MKPQLNRYEIKAGINKTFVFVSDLHNAEYDELLSMISECRPHGILVGGDFTHNSKNRKNGLVFLREATKISPVFVSLGNHECLTDVIREEVKDSGAILLDNNFVSHDGFVIGGLTPGDFYTDGLPRTDFLDEFCKEDSYRILLCHHPEYYEKYLKNKSIDLILSGHAHGGQWRIFGRGIYAPGQGIFPKYTSGMYDGKLIVGRGLANMVKIPRINNKTEIILLKIC